MVLAPVRAADAIRLSATSEGCYLSLPAAFLMCHDLADVQCNAQPTSSALWRLRSAAHDPPSSSRPLFFPDYRRGQVTWPSPHDKGDLNQRAIPTTGDARHRVLLVPGLTTSHARVASLRRAETCRNSRVLMGRGALPGSAVSRAVSPASHARNRVDGLFASAVGRCGNTTHSFGACRRFLPCPLSTVRKRLVSEASGRRAARSH